MTELGRINTRESACCAGDVHQREGRQVVGGTQVLGRVRVLGLQPSDHVGVLGHGRLWRRLVEDGAHQCGLPQLDGLKNSGSRLRR